MTAFRASLASCLADFALTIAHMARISPITPTMVLNVSRLMRAVRPRRGHAQPARRRDPAAFRQGARARPPACAGRWGASAYANLIGRASCRARGCRYVWARGVAGYLK